MDFDVFLPHNSADKPAVEKIARKLKDAGLNLLLEKVGLDLYSHLAAVLPLGHLKSLLHR